MFEAPGGNPSGSTGFVRLEFWERAGLEIHIREGGVGVQMVLESMILDEITEGVATDREGVKD